MKMKKTAVAAALVASGLFAQGASAETIDLTGLGYVQYGDALSYSLPIANYQVTGNVSGPGPYTIQSSPGQIDQLTVLGTGSSGNPVVNNFNGMDNAYATPSGVSGTTFFYPNQLNYQGTQGTVANNGTNTWDASLASLQTFLNGSQMVVFFNNNQVNSGDTSLQSLAAWARVWITAPDGSVLPGSTFELTNMGGKYALVSEGGGGVFLGDPTTYTAPGSGAGDPNHVDGNQTDFVLSGGQVCVETGPGVGSIPVPVPCGSAPMFAGDTVSDKINHNLGADTAAYAILFPELNALLDSLFGSGGDLSGYTFHADVRLGCDFKTVNATEDGYTNDPYGEGFVAPCDPVNGWGTALNNGYEQFFIGTAIVPQVPEPGTLGLIGAALMAAFGLRRRMVRG